MWQLLHADSYEEPLVRARHHMGTKDGGAFHEEMAVPTRGATAPMAHYIPLKMQIYNTSMTYCIAFMYLYLCIFL